MTFSIARSTKGRQAQWITVVGVGSAVEKRQAARRAMLSEVEQGDEMQASKWSVH